MAEQKKRSYIVGQAQVVFGGGIAINVGTIGGDPNTMAIGLAELKNPAPDAGCEVDDNAETFGIQVALIFRDLHSLEHFRGVLNDLEVMLKERMTSTKESTEENPILQKRIIDCGLSVRTFNICHANGIETLRDLVRLQKNCWLKFRNSGKKSLTELDELIKDHDLEWGMNV